ncbi:MAG: AAA family ATPase [Oscillospiraceae bacterium]|nr:AAA family ATPase [Oscillospiraceae bacterium]
MKKIYIIGGTMGVGKTTVSQRLKTILPDSVFLDGDWCWDAHPFKVTDETKKMVMENIIFLLNQFIHCSAFENIIFCWVMHEQSIIDNILAGIDKQDCEVKVISLVCDPETLKNRIQKDINDGKRTIESIKRSTDRLPLYNILSTIKIKTDNKSVDRIAEEITLCMNIVT